MPATDLTVLFRDVHWLAVDKPSGLPTTAPDTAAVTSLVDRVRAELAPDAQHVHPLSRLDVPVTGVVLFALTSGAISAANKARARGKYHRRYLALLSRAPDPPAGAWTWTIGVDPRDPKRRVAGGGREPQEARTEYVTRGASGIAWVEFDLRTGRTHQIRAHAQRAGCPVLGDRAYGAPSHLTLDDGAVVSAKRVMLHASRVCVPGTSQWIAAPVPEDLRAVWSACGGREIEPATK